MRGKASKITFTALLILSCHAFAVDRITLPDHVTYKQSEPAFAYYKRSITDPEGAYNALEVMSTRAYGDIRESSLLYLARMELHGIAYPRNYPKALEYFTEAADFYAENSNRDYWVSETFRSWHKEEQSPYRRLEIQYLQLAYLRNESRDVSFLSEHASIGFMVHSLKTILTKRDEEKFLFQDHTKQTLEAGDVTALNAQSQILLGIWRLADQGFPQAQFEIALYLLQNPLVKNPNDPRYIQGIAYLKSAAYEGHRSAAETLIDALWRHPSHQAKLDTCAIVLAYMVESKKRLNRRLRFYTAAPECGTPESPFEYNKSLFSNINQKLEVSGIYLAEGNIAGHGKALWLYEY